MQICQLFFYTFENCCSGGGLLRFFGIDTRVDSGKFAGDFDRFFEIFFDRWSRGVVEVIEPEMSDEVPGSNPA
jgi:hypothetical protein